MTTDGRIEAQFTVPSATTISCATNAGGPTAVTITAGSYYLSTFVTQLQTDLNAQRTVTAGSWTVTYSTGASGTLKITIAVTNGSYSITWTSTDARDLLGFTANITSQTTSTGTNQARGVWGPDRPLTIKSSPNTAPRITDKRSTQSPTGVVLALKGNEFFRHEQIAWQGVAKNRVWIGAETTTNQSWEKFMLDTQLADGHAWFALNAKVQIFDIQGVKVGIYGNSGSGMAGWTMQGVDNIDPVRTDPTWDGAWTIEIPTITTDA